MISVAFAARPPRPKSYGAQPAAAAAPPPFAARPARSTTQHVEEVAPSRVEAEAPVSWRPASLGPPPGQLELPAEFQHLQTRQALARPPAQPNCSVRRSQSEAPPTSLGHGVENFAYPRPPLIRNVASFEKPRECSKALNGMPALQQSLPQACGSSRSSRRCQRSPIDEAVQREFIGDGLALEQAVDARRDAGWAVKQRHVQRSDVGHCCYSCRQPLRDMNEEVVVWTGAAIYRRFHPRCAAGYMLRADAAQTNTSSASHGASTSDVVEGYADGWRALRDEAPLAAGGRNQRAVQAARQWLLSQDPTAFSALRGDLFTTVTIMENGKKKAVPGLTHDQLNILQTRHRWHTPIDALGDCPDSPQLLECPICFAALDLKSPPCVRLPCAPQHVCHIDCIWPWLRKASICPICRKDLRTLLPPARGASVPPLPARSSMSVASREAAES